MNMNSWKRLLTEQLLREYTQDKRWGKMSHHWCDGIVNRDHIDTIALQLNSAEKKVLLSLLTSPLIIPTEEEQVLRKLKGNTRLAGQHILRSLFSLANIGVLQVRHDPWIGLVWNMPFPIFHMWRKYFALNKISWKQTIAPFGETFTFIEHNKRLLGKQLFHLLLVLSQLNLNYTKKGIWSKAVVQKCQRSCEELQRTIGQLQLSFLEGQDNDALKLLLELATGLGMLEKGETKATISYEKLENWLLLSDQEREQLHKQWFYESIAGFCQHDFIVTVLSDLFHLEQGTWFQLQKNDCAQELLPWLSMVSALGWLSYSFQQSDQGIMIYVCMRQLHEESEINFDIQENAEIVVLPNCSYRQLWLLHEMADCLTEQELSIYRLNLRHTISSHYTVENCIEWLTESHEGSLPSIVSQLFLAHHDMQEESINRKVSLAMIVEKKKQQPLELIPLDTWGQWLEIPQLYVHRMMNEHERKDRLASLYDHHVSSSWLHEFRTYHPSTSLQLVNYAIEHQLSLAIRSQSKACTISPERLIQKGQTWWIEGFSDEGSDSFQKLWELNDWDGIKLQYSYEE